MSSGLRWGNPSLGFILCPLEVDSTDAGSAPTSHRKTTDLENTSSPEGLCELLLDCVQPHAAGIKTGPPPTFFWKSCDLNRLGFLTVRGLLSPPYWVHFPTARHAGFLAQDLQGSVKWTVFLAHYMCSQAARTYCSLCLECPSLIKTLIVLIVNNSVIQRHTEPNTHLLASGKAVSRGWGAVDINETLHRSFPLSPLRWAIHKLSTLSSTQITKDKV